MLLNVNANENLMKHDDAIQWKHFPRHWPFLWGIHRSPVNFPHKSQWRGALMFSLICAWINAWVNNREAGDLRHHRANYDVTVMLFIALITFDSFGTTQSHLDILWCIKLSKYMFDGHFVVRRTSSGGLVVYILGFVLQIPVWCVYMKQAELTERTMY